MEHTTENQNKRKYWVNVEHYNEDPAMIEKAQTEFSASPIRSESDVSGDSNGTTRREFMKLMAAGTALASSACYKMPMEKILPYVNQPEGVTFGVANYYASTCTECASACGTLVKTREGRPIKLEGNPDHPMNKGGLCARGQASILNLYDPDRLRMPVNVDRNGHFTTTTWNELDKRVAAKLKSSSRVRLLTESTVSPSTQKLIKEFLSRFSDGRHVSYDVLGYESIIDGQEQCYGTRVLPRYRFDLADVVVSIDADFLGTWISPVEYTKQFAEKRALSKNKKSITKLYSFDSMMTVTASNADARLAIRPEDGARIALAIANELVTKHGVSADGQTSSFLARYKADNEVVKQAAHDLARARGRSLVVAGSPNSKSQNDLSLQVAVNLLNSMLKNDGVTVDHSSSPSLQDQGRFSDLLQLIDDMKAGRIDALLVYKANPVYNMPLELGFSEALKKVPFIASFSDRVDETAALGDCVLPDNHGLESWGDAQPQRGLYSLTQPTIRPIYDTRSFQDSLLTLSSIKMNWHSYLQNNWRETVYKESGSTISFDLFWEGALRDGVVNLKKQARDNTGSARNFKSSSLIAPTAENTDYSLTFYANVAHYDGSAANNPWLLELPDPVTRVTWDNYASVSPHTAEKLGLKDGFMVRIKTNTATITLPAHVQPGLHDKVVAIALGYGRTLVGGRGNGIGQNMFPHTTLVNKRLTYSGQNATLMKTGVTYTLASTQDHHTMEGRPIVKEASLEEYLKDPHAGNEHHEHLTTLWSGHEYKGYRWGMAIDLNRCTGCNACVIGCQSENNIPTVGKHAVSVGRIMHWIRIDRYYTGTPDNPQVVHQPMLCQHCENAPCETVCPVLATVHSDEGLNSQIYNRCVGTRYCSNNCPYKVRRFNWFDYNFDNQMQYPLTLSQNPEVTVRSRGIMEKCTFCIQRIQEVKNTAKDEARDVRDGEIKTACQQSCPADAIVFGNINDLTSQVSQNMKDPRGYTVLEELNTRPSVTYLTKIRNVEHA